MGPTQIRCYLFYTYMKMRRRTYHRIVDDTSIVKALALFCYLKQLFPASVITDYTKDKIHKLTGLHSTTIGKRIKTLLKLGYVRIENGKNGKQRLILNKIASRHKERNIDLCMLVFDSVKTVEKSLLALFIVEVERRKIYAEQVIYKAHNSYDTTELKRMKKAAQGIRGSEKGFKDNGLSYKTIAKRLKISVQKAQKIVDFAVKFEFVVKIKRQFQTFCRNAFRFFEFEKEKKNCKYTFATSNNLYQILANQYRLGNRVASDVELIR